jgi:hypothetical protein
MSGAAVFKGPRVRDESINVLQYGVAASGLVDDYTGFAAAHAAALAVDGSGNLKHSARIVIPPNSRILLSPTADTAPISLPPNTDPAKRVVWDFQGGSHLVRSANYRTMFRPGRTADYQTWRGYRFQNPRVDGNAIVGVSEDDVFFGPTRAGSSGFAQRNNYTGLEFINPSGWNIPAGGNGGPVQRFINLLSRQVKTNEGDQVWNPASLSQTLVTNNIVENLQLDGCDYGVAMLGGIQMGSTAGARIKNFAGTPTVINFTGKTSGTFVVDEWLYVGVGQWWERHHITAVTDNGDGTGSLTLAAALGFPQPTDDGNGAGNGAPIVCGNVSNVWVDGNKITGGWAHGGTGGYGSGIHLVGTGIGGHGNVVEDIELSGFGDNNLEVDNPLSFVGRDIRSIDPGNQSYMFRVFNMPQDQQNRGPLHLSQSWTLEDSTHQIENVQPTTSVPARAIYAGYNWTPGHTPAGASPMAGTVKLRRFKVADKNAQMRSIQGEAIYCWHDCSLTRIEGDIEYVKDRVSDASSAAPRPVYVSPSSNTVVDLKVKQKFAGGASSSGQPTYVHAEPFTPTGQTAQHDLRADIMLDIRNTLTGLSAGATRFFDLGESVSASGNKGTLHGTLGAKVTEWGGSDTAPVGVRYNGGGQLNILERIVHSGWDLSKAPTGLVIQQFRPTGSVPLSYQRKIVWLANNILIGTFSNFTGSGQFLGSGSGFQEYDVTLSGTAAVWINETTVPCWVFLTGGTVTSIDFSYNGGTTYQNGKIPVPPVGFRLLPNQAIRVNNTGVPSMFVTPQPY